MVRFDLDSTAFDSAGGDLVSFGSGSGSRAAQARYSGNAGRRKATNRQKSALASQAREWINDDRTNKSRKAKLRRIVREAQGAKRSADIGNLRRQLAELVNNIA